VGQSPDHSLQIAFDHRKMKKNGSWEKTPGKGWLSIFLRTFPNTQETLTKIL